MRHIYWKKLLPPDTELLELARKFDPQALAQIYDNFSPGLYRYSIRRLSDQTVAEDCVAETFSRFLQALRDDRGPDNFLQAFLYRIAHNWIIDHYRRLPIQPLELTDERMDDTADPEKDAGRNQQQEQLRWALRKLTPEQQQVLALKYLEGWENEEIARSLKKPVGAVKSLQHRALVALKKILDREDFL
jgi:RNA polymerase sigma-70 factor (ECF subfamily)